MPVKYLLRLTVLRGSMNGFQLWHAFPPPAVPVSAPRPLIQPRFISVSSLSPKMNQSNAPFFVFDVQDGT
jgi:hypothetical protein